MMPRFSCPIPLLPLIRPDPLLANAGAAAMVRIAGAAYPAFFKKSLRDLLCSLIANFSLNNVKIILHKQ